ncbi:NRP-like protein [Mya arenaria]|uniref:NRP-like protein n=1 Tax=Mya arenaria TaxID=6604 RepID=A0ABY7G391_MYAAR|nr:NRP-like protein [Mya arenaria]
MHGGGFGSFLPKFDPSSSPAGFNLDPSTIAGISSGQTIYLTGDVGDQVLSGVPLNVVSPDQLNQGQHQGNEPRFVTQNEEFTALGQIGKQVRVLDTSQSGGGSSTTNAQGNNMGMLPHLGSGAIDMSNIHGSGPIEIVGVADLTNVDAQGNPVFSFNPGSGHASELAALNSALHGTAVDMTNFLPPTFEKDPASAQNSGLGTSGRGFGIGSNIPSPHDINQQLDIILNEGTNQSGSDMSTIIGDMRIGIGSVNRMVDSLGNSASSSSHNSLVDMVNPSSLSSLTSGTIITQEQLLQMLRQDMNTNQNVVHNDPPMMTSSLASEMGAGLGNEYTPVDMTNFLPPLNAGIHTEPPSVSVDGMDASVATSVNHGLFGNQRQSKVVDGMDASSKSSMDLPLGHQTRAASVDGMDMAVHSNVDAGPFGSEQQSVTSDGADMSLISQRNVGGISNHKTVTNVDGSDGTFTVTNDVLGLSKTNTVNIDGGDITVNTNVELGTLGSAEHEMSMDGSHISGIPPPPMQPAFSWMPAATTSAGAVQSASHTVGDTSTGGVALDNAISDSSFPFINETPMSPTEQGTSSISKSGGEATPNVIPDISMSFNDMPSTGAVNVRGPTVSQTSSSVSNTERVASDKSDTTMSFHRASPMSTSLRTESSRSQSLQEGTSFVSKLGEEPTYNESSASTIFSGQPQFGGQNDKGPNDSQTVRSEIHGGNSGVVATYIVSSDAPMSFNGLSSMAASNEILSPINPNVRTRSTMDESISNVGLNQSQLDRNFPSGIDILDGQTSALSGSEATGMDTSVVQPSQSLFMNVNLQTTSNNASLDNSNNPKNNQMRLLGQPETGNVNQAINNAQTNVANPDEPHVNDLTADGIYPFEGSFDARDATLAEGKPAIMDMTAIMETQTNINDTLHLENTFDPTTTSNDISNTSDGAGPPLTGTNGGPITNMVGAKPKVEENTPVGSEIGLVAVGTGKGGSVSPNLVLHKNPAFKRQVAPADAGGGFSIGGNEINSVLNKISLPDKAFIPQKSDNVVADTPKVQKPVDMSSFVPPEIERSAEPQAVSQFQSVNKPTSEGVGHTASSAFKDSSSQIRDSSHVQSQTRNIPSRAVSNFNPLQGVRDTSFPNWAAGLQMTDGGASVSNKVASAIQQMKAANSGQSNGQNSIRTTAWSSSGSDLTGGVALPGSVAVRLPQQNLAMAVTLPPQTEQAQPIVGSIFGNSVVKTPKKISQKFIESSGLMTEPEVDFMTSFLNPTYPNTPSRTFNRGRQNVQIVPLGSDVSKVEQNSNNMFIVGRGQGGPSEPTVDQFGVADIYRRKQQLNSNQWNTFMNSISVGATNRRNSLPPYQTQNVIGTSETRPLNTRSDLVAANPKPALVVEPKPVVTNRRQLFNTGVGSNAITTLFEAPGRTGHKSVSISLFPSSRSSKATSNANRNAVTAKGSQSVSSNVFSRSGGEQMATRNTLGLRDETQGQFDPVVMSTSDVQRQILNKFVSQQPTAANSNQFAKSLKQGLDSGAKGLSIMDEGFQATGTNPIVEPKRQSFGFKTNEQGLRNTGSTADHSDFKLGKSIMISDGVIPDFVMDPSKGTVTATDLKNMASGGFRLGQPVSMRKNTDSTMTNIGTSSNLKPLIETNMNSNTQTNLADLSNQGGASTSMSNAFNNFLTQTQHGQGNVVPGGQMIEPTKFTSGNRPAVFGPANGDERTASRVIARINKPAKAMRMGILGPVHECRYRPDPSSKYFFLHKDGKVEHRLRCAIGTAFDEMTCECSIRVTDHDDCLEVHMDFNNGMVEDSSVNNLPIGNENVEITNSSSPLAGIALFGGDGKLTIWRYQNYDFRDHIMLKVQFRPGPGGDRVQSLISNCGKDAPSVAILYDGQLQEVVLVLQTDNDTLKELRFVINPNEWNDVTYIYDGQEFIGIVNGVRRYVSRQDPHLLGIIGGEIKSVKTKGIIEIRHAPLILGQCPLFGNYIGAMVDIQVYTCIPRDFRLE